MFHEGTRVGRAFAFWRSTLSLALRPALHPETRQFAIRESAAVAAVFAVGIALLIAPPGMLAQRGGGGAPAGGGGGVPGAGRPGGVSEKDELKDFHRAMAVRATTQQSAAFAGVVQDAEAAGDQLSEFREALRKAFVASEIIDRSASLDQAIQKARNGNQSFVASFSSVQKSGLKDNVKKLEKSDSDLAAQIKSLTQIVQTGKPGVEQVTNSAANLDKALNNFQNEQLALGREMSILLPISGRELAFNLSSITSSITIAGQPVSVAASGAVSRTSAENDRNIFSLKLVADLSDLQHNMNAILRSQLNRSPRCGERVEIRDATLTLAAPGALVVARLHYERWICASGAGPTELADGNGEIEIKLTPSIDQNGSLHLVSEITRVTADRFLRDLLRSGDLGDTFRGQIEAAVISAMEKAADLKSALPPVAQGTATLQKAEFQSAGANQLSMVVAGELQLSDEQTKQFATQLKQRLSAQGTSAP